MARVYLKGLPELKKKLIALKEKTETEVLEAVARAADDVVAMMKRLAPVDDGDLRDSIGWTFGAAPKRSIKIASVKATSVTQITIYAGNEKAFYAHMVEFGTRAHSLRKGDRLSGKSPFQSSTGPMHKGTPAHPFFYPSWRAMKKPVKRAIARAVQEAIRNVSRT